MSLDDDDDNFSTWNAVEWHKTQLSCAAACSFKLIFCQHGSERLCADDEKKISIQSSLFPPSRWAGNFRVLYLVQLNSFTFFFTFIPTRRARFSVFIQMRRSRRARADEWDNGKVFRRERSTRRDLVGDDDNEAFFLGRSNSAFSQLWDREATSTLGSRVLSVGPISRLAVLITLIHVGLFRSDDKICESEDFHRFSILCRTRENCTAHEFRWNSLSLLKRRVIFAFLHKRISCPFRVAVMQFVTLWRSRNIAVLEQANANDLLHQIKSFWTLKSNSWCKLPRQTTSRCNLQIDFL